ncbi:MAG: lysozyme [Litorimonas sp.]
MIRILQISDIGLRLIKAFEGFRPDDRMLSSGVRIVGYGHTLDDDADPVHMSRVEAEEQLLKDLEPIELFVNEEVHAPLTQWQYDSLCSLAFNIGLESFRRSDIVRALNNGRVLDAANGFDHWRKATVQGRTYVVDALVRRRTAEKSLFLRHEPAVPTPGALLVPLRDEGAPFASTDDGLPTVTPEGTHILSETRAVVATEAPSDLTDEMEAASEFAADLVDEADTVQVDDATVPEPTEVDEHENGSDHAIIIDPGAELAEAVEETKDPATRERSAIADAADALGSRLDALLDTEDAADDAALSKALPDSLIKSASDDEPTTVLASDIAVTPSGEESARSNLVSFPKRELVLVEGDVSSIPEAVAAPEGNVDACDMQTDDSTVVIDNLEADDMLRANGDPDTKIFSPEADPEESARDYIERQKAGEAETSGGGGIWIPIAFGALLLGASAALMGQGATRLLSSWGPTAVVAAAITGGLTLLFAFYAFMRGRFA